MAKRLIPSMWSDASEVWAVHWQDGRLELVVGESA
jgi:hypothetical protein